jgi:hypothetical protein
MSLLSILCYLRKEKDWGGGPSVSKFPCNSQGLEWTKSILKGLTKRRVSQSESLARIYFSKTGQSRGKWGRKRETSASCAGDRSEDSKWWFLFLGYLFGDSILISHLDTWSYHLATPNNFYKSKDRDNGFRACLLPKL